MILHPIPRLLFFVILLFIALSIVLIVPLTAGIVDDNCIGEKNGCPVCQRIKTAKSFIRTIKTAGVFLLCAVSLVLYARMKEKNHIFCLSPISPVILKVRFNT